MGKGSRTQVGSVWSKSVEKSSTGGRAAAVTTAILPDTGSDPPSSITMAYSGQLAAARRAFSSWSGGTTPSFSSWDWPIVVDVEQLRRDGEAAVVALALLLVDMDPHGTSLMAPSAGLRTGHRR